VQEINWSSGNSLKF